MLDKTLLLCLFGCAAALLPLAGCASNDETTARQTSAIVEGTLDPNPGDRAVVMIIWRNPAHETMGPCSGTLVSPHVVVTAAHCLTPSTVGSDNTYAIFLGDDDFAADQTGKKSNWVYVHEMHFDPKFDANDLRGGHDVGVLITDTAIDIPPMPMLRTPLSAADQGTALRVVGFGQSIAADAGSYGQRRSSSATLAGLDDKEIWLADGHICHGDSGGAALLDRNGTLFLAGIHSWVEHTQSCTGLDYETRVDTVTSFVDPYITSADPGFFPADAGLDARATDDAGDGAGGSRAATTSGCSSAPNQATYRSRPESAAALLFFACALARRRARNKA